MQGLVLREKSWTALYDSPKQLYWQMRHDIVVVMVEEYVSMFIVAIGRVQSTLKIT